MKLKNSIPKKTLYWLFKSASQDFANEKSQLFKNESQTFESITFLQMFETASKLSAGLMSIGMQPKDRVCLIADVGPKWMLCSMAITGAGAVDVPRGTDTVPKEVLYILDHSECKITFFQNLEIFQALRKEIPALVNLKSIVFFENPGKSQFPDSINVYTVDELIKAGDKTAGRYSEAGEKIEEEDLATIIYTSGTTGIPKGAMITHKNLISGVLTITNALPSAPGEVTMGYMPPWHIAERMVETSSFYLGHAIAFTSIVSMAKDLQTVRPHYLMSVPKVWESMYSKIHNTVAKAPPVKKGLFNFAKAASGVYRKHLDEFKGNRILMSEPNLLVLVFKKGYSFFMIFLLFFPGLAGRAILGKIKENLGGRLRYALSGAGALSEHVDKFFHAAGIPILEIYGMTETTGLGAMRAFDNPVPGTVGKKFSHFNLELRSEDGEVIKEPGVKGVAWHKGDHVMKGYYRNTELTAKALQDGWFNSGDLLKWTANGYLKFAGRAKDTINLSGGEKVEPAPVEAQLARHAMIQYAVIFGQDQKAIYALIVPDFEIVKSYCLENGLGEPGDPATWNSNQSLRSIFKNIVKTEICKENGFKSYERIADFYLLSTEFKIGVELTQTLKVKRDIVFEKYKKEMEAILP